MKILALSGVCFALFIFLYEKNQHVLAYAAGALCLGLLALAIARGNRTE